MFMSSPCNRPSVRCHVCHFRSSSFDCPSTVRAIRSRRALRPSCPRNRINSSALRSLSRFAMRFHQRTVRYMPVLVRVSTCSPPPDRITESLFLISGSRSRHFFCERPLGAAFLMSKWRQRVKELKGPRRPYESLQNPDTAHNVVAPRIFLVHGPVGEVHVIRIA